MSKSPTIIDGEIGGPANWLHNPHAGEMLALEFLEPIGMTASELAAAIGVEEDLVSSVIDGTRQMDAALDLRLGRFFGMGDGFFLGLQHDFELLEAKRHLSGALDRIVPRAA